MSSYNNSVNAGSELLWGALQQQSEQSQENQRKANERASAKQRKNYRNERTASHARSLQSAKKEALKKGKSVERVRTTRARQDDHLLPASTDDFALLKSASSKPLAKTPLPTPAKPFGEDSQNSDDDHLSIIAILAKVLILQAQTNSQVWKVLWKQSGDFMSLSYNMAKAQATATESQWTEQSAATKAQASMSKQDGMVDISFFAMSTVAGFVDPGEEGDKPSPTDSDDGVVSGEDNTAAAQQQMSQELSETNQAAQEQGQTAADQEETKSSKIMKKMGSTMNKCGNMLLKGMQKFGGGIKYAQYFQMAGGGIKGLWVDAPKLASKAAHEQAAGQQAAAAQLAQGIMEYYNQNYSRSEEIRQSANQNLEYAMQVYKAASDAVTQAVSAMFSR